MEYIDIVKKYDEELEKFSDNNLSYFENFLKFVSNSNVGVFDTMNKVLVYGSHNKADFFATFEYWKKQGRIPKRGTGICIYKDNVSKYIFAKNDTVQMQQVDKKDSEINKVQGLFTEDTLTKKISNIKSVKRLANSYNTDELVAFIEQSIHCIDDNNYHYSDEMEEIYKKYKLSSEELFGWIVPVIYDCHKNLVKAKEKENEIDGRIDDRRDGSNDEHSDSGESERVSSVPAERNVAEVGERESRIINVMGDQRETVGELKEDEQVLSKDRRGNDEDSREITDADVSDKNESDRASGTGQIVSESKDDNSINVSIPYDITDTHSNPYVLGHQKNSGDMFLSESEKFGENCIAYGYFPNYYECSDACYFLDRLSKEEKKKYYFDDGILHTDEEYAEKTALFEKDFADYRETRDYLKCNFEMYRNIIDTAKNEKRELTVEELSVLFILQQIEKHSNVNELIYDVFNSDITEDARNEFVETIYKDCLVGSNEWGKGEILKNDEKDIDIAIFPHSININTSVTDKAFVNVKIEKITELLKEVVKDNYFTIADHTKDFEKGGLYIGEETYKKYRTFQEKYGFEDIMVKTRCYKFRNKDISTITSEETKEELAVFTVVPILHEQKWDQKYALADLYESNLPFEERIEQLKRLLKRFDNTSCLSINDINKFQKLKRRTVVGNSLSDDGGSVKVFEDGKFYQVNISWEELDSNFAKLVENNELIYSEDVEARAKYFAECFDNIEKEMAPDKKGYPQFYLDTLKAAYEHDRLLREREVLQLTLVTILCDRDHDRYRKYMKEAMLQKDLSEDVKVEFLKEFMGHCFYKYFGTYNGWICNTDENGVLIAPSDNLFNPNSYSNRVACKVQEKIERTYLPWEEALAVCEEVCLNENFLPRDREYGCNGRLPEGTIEFYNNFKNSHNFKELYDTSQDTYEATRKNEVKAEAENEQMDIFNYMKKKGKSR